MFIVYQITNNINGHYYRGKTSLKHWDKGYMGSGDLIQAAIAKYGKENFTRHVLANCDTEEEAYYYEKRLITTNKQDPKSYNIAPGGLGIGSGEEHPKYGKIGKNRGKKNPLLSQSMSGENNHQYGKTGAQSPRYGKPRPDLTNRNPADHPMFGKPHPSKGKRTERFGKPLAPHMREKRLKLFFDNKLAKQQTAIEHTYPIIK